MNNGPDLWDAVLTHVRAVFPEAVIAGGCVRDYLNGKPAKDIDVFVDGTGFNRDGMALCDPFRVVESPDFIYLRAFDPAYGTDHGRGGDHSMVYCATYVFDDIAIQIIALDLSPWGGWSEANAVNRIDLGLCRVSYSGRSKGGVPMIHHGIGYWGDFQARKMTVLRADTEAQYRGSVKRHERLSAKYPGYPLIDGRRYG